MRENRTNFDGFVYKIGMPLRYLINDEWTQHVTVVFLEMWLQITETFDIREQANASQRTAK